MNWFSRSYLTVVYLFFYIPIAVLIIYSFNDTQYSLLWHGFSWRWYKVLLSDTDLLTAAWHSLILGTLAASFAVILGSFAAVSLYRYQFWGRRWLYITIFILIVLPDIVIGTSLLVLYNYLHLQLGFLSLLIAHITFCIPFVTVIIYSRLTTFDKNIFEAAVDLGANNATIFWKIIIPLLFPGLVAAWLLSFTLSIDDVLISYFVSGPSFQILPLEIYAMVRLGISPEINALATIIFILTLVLVFCSQLALRKR